MKIKNIIPEERPRERCISQGPHVLSLRECLAVLIGSGPRKIGCLGVAKNILHASQKHLRSDEAERAFFENFHSISNILTQTKGLGDASLARILVSLDLGRRYHEFLTSNEHNEEGIFESELEKNILKNIPISWRAKFHEWIGFVPVYSERNIGKLCIVEKGVRTHVNFEMSHLFSKILLLRPKAFALVHNHPSGRATPSESDKRITDNIAETSRHLGLIFLGHWIVTKTKSRKIKC